jgi:hypothetical protein
MGDRIEKAQQTLGRADEKKGIRADAWVFQRSAVPPCCVEAVRQVLERLAVV